MRAHVQLFPEGKRRLEIGGNTPASGARRERRASARDAGPLKERRKVLTCIMTRLLLATASYSPKGSAPFPEVLQYWVDAWSGRSKLLLQLPASKIHLIYCPRIEDVSDIKLIRTDTTLDLSQKAEKR